ncbi:MAG TPA: hypothetical protein VMV90_06480 [Rectinemataceae bacterium]|nr:hypothetical protein [Rectinemataceae bacterium]
MSFVESAIDDRLVTEAEKAAFEVLPLLAGASGELRNRYAVQLADLMGDPGEFQHYLVGSSADRLARIDRLLRVFHENVELLVHKTWVEKTDEKPKERLLDDLSAVERDFREGAIAPAFKRFVALAHAIAHLLFGQQSRASDFLVYCFRIDPKFGLFFWYIDQLEAQARGPSLPTDELMTLETLLGVYVLSSF